ncbi:MAG: hypothetical protein CVT73_22915 [Alphaproteobacteria bacterium HGW-Alphaproteobacteria-12]|nr:MAG: hypothetical protein CVT73_22915 [Alphaproteobacteria bacterium HGW-Alphaproteobacteria-12]
MDAALEQSPSDLLLLLDGLPRPDTWHLGSGFLAALLQEAESDGMHSLYRYAHALLRERLGNASGADFLALKSACRVLLSTGVMVEDTKAESSTKMVHPVVLDVFPSIANRETELLARDIALRWRPETESDPVVLNEIIRQRS